jgi:hypothetical protein
MTEGNSNLSGSIVVFALIFLAGLNWVRAGCWRNLARGRVS